MRKPRSSAGQARKVGPRGHDRQAANAGAMHEARAPRESKPGAGQSLVPRSSRNAPRRKGALGDGTDPVYHCQSQRRVVSTPSLSDLFFCVMLGFFLPSLLFSCRAFRYLSCPHHLHQLLISMGMSYALPKTEMVGMRMAGFFRIIILSAGSEQG